MAGIFISYRREDSRDAAGRLYDALAREFGDERVFMDVDAIRPGDDFVERVEDTVREADTFLAVIGRHWVSATDAQGRRRLENARDFVRLEIERALGRWKVRRDIRVIPVLLEDTVMPGPEDLPSELGDLWRLQAFRLSYESWGSDIQRLLGQLRSIADEQRERHKAAERERAEREREALERAERERAEREAAENERAEQEARAREAAKQEAAKREQLEREALERAERERAERKAAERAEQIARARERARREAEERSRQEADERAHREAEEQAQERERQRRATAGRPDHAPGEKTATLQKPRLREAGFTQRAVGAIGRHAASLPVVLGAVVVIAVVAIGFWIGRASRGDTVNLRNVVSTGALTLQMPEGWRPSAVPRVPGLAFRTSVAMSPPGGPNHGVLAGVYNATAPSLLPAGLQSRLGKMPAAREVFAIGKLHAVRYANLQPKGFAGRLDMYAIPTSGGVATVVCFSLPRGSPPSECDQIANTARLTGVRGFPVGPRREYAAAVNGVLHRLNGARLAGVRRFRLAKTSRSQASAARRIAASYRGAAGQLAQVELSPREVQRTSALAAALRGVATTYVRLATAAAQESKADYAARLRQVRAAQAHLQTALRGLNALGYSVK